MNKQIIAVCGRKKAGKDFFAKLIKDYDPNFVIVHFADRIKAMLVSIFPISDHDLQNSILKDMPFSSFINMDEYIDKMSELTGLKILPKKKVATSPRELMQFFGTDYVRSVDDNYWVKYLLNLITGKDKVIIADLRFLNEEVALKEIGAVVVRIIRQDTETPDLHPSEHEQLLISEDVTIETKTGNVVLLKSVVKSLVERELKFPADIFSID